MLLLWGGGGFVSLQKGEQPLGSQALSSALRVDEQKPLALLLRAQMRQLVQMTFRAHFLTFPLHSSCASMMCMLSTAQPC